MIKSRIVKWTGNVAHMEGMKDVYKILVEKLKLKRLF